MNFFPCKNLSRKHYSLQESSNEFFSLQESFKETVFLARILQGNLFLARFLQDVLQKNALSCKTLKENLARSLQGTHFFQPGKELISLQELSWNVFSFEVLLQRSDFLVRSLARNAFFLPYKYEVFNFTGSHNFFNYKIILKYKQAENSSVNLKSA